MCGLYYPHSSNTIFISKEIRDDAEGENAYEEDEDKLQVKKIQPTYLRISIRYDPCMPMMTSKNWDAVALLFKITTVLKLSPTLLTQKMPWPSVFLTSKISPLQSALLTLPSYLLTFYTHTPLSIWASWVPSPSSWKTHPPLFLLHLRGQLTPFSF